MNVFKIKRSASSNSPSSLAEGELAYSFASDTLFIGGQNGVIISIGGQGAYAKRSGSTYTGVHNFTGATVNAATQPAGTNNTTVATTAFVVAAMAGAGAGDMLKATYDSNNSGVVDDAEKLGGTAAASYALKTYVDTKISDLVNGAGASLDTLKELADALGGDANFAATVSGNIAQKLTKTSNLSDLSDVAQARSNLGLGSLALQSAASVNITGGNISGVTLDNLTIDCGTF